MPKNDGKRKEIIETAYVLLLEKGYEDTGIQDILDKLSVTKGCLYYHFKSKRDIAIAVIEEIIKPTYGILWQEIGVADNPLDEILRTIDRIFLARGDTLARVGCPLGNLILELSAKDKILSESINSVIDAWQSLIERALNSAKDSGIIRNGLNLSEISKFIMASFEGCIMIAKSSQDKIVLESCFSVLKDYLLSLKV